MPQVDESFAERGLQEWRFSVDDLDVGNRKLYADAHPRDQAKRGD